MMKKRINNALISSYCDRINVSGIVFDRKTFRNKFNDYDIDYINDYMTDILNKDSDNIVKALNSISVNAHSNRKLGKINIIIDEIKKHFHGKDVIFNSEDNTFIVNGNNEEDVVLRLEKNDGKYSVKKVEKKEGTNNLNTASKGKQFILSNGKQSSKLFMDSDTD